jgi:phosphoribosylformylglycinamidine synthase subunit PurS
MFIFSAFLLDALRVRKGFHAFGWLAEAMRTGKNARPTRVQWRFKMKARIYVTMKPTVLDPQGQTICSALQGMGHREIAAVRQGKYFEIGLADGLSRDSALKMLDEVASDVLSNPVIEDYRLEILD